MITIKLTNTKTTLYILIALLIIITTPLNSLANSNNHHDKHNNKHNHSHENNTFVQSSAFIEQLQEIDNTMMQNMQSAPLSQNAEMNFVLQMIPHHLGAVKMAETYQKFALKESTKQKELIQLTQNIEKDQEDEISIMKDWIIRQPLPLEKTIPESAFPTYQKALDGSMAVMHNVTLPPEANDDINLAFVLMMIPHHQSAIDMANAYLPFAVDPEIIILANSIIEEQKYEIELMNNWLKINN